MFNISLLLLLLSVSVFKEVKGLCVRLVIVLVLKKIMLHLFPELHSYWFSEKNKLREFHVSGNVLMFRLTRKSPTKQRVHRSKSE